MQIMGTSRLLLAILIFLMGACAPQPSPSPVPPSTPDEVSARDTLTAFFQLLNEGRYDEAASLYGGPYDSLRDNNPSLSPTDIAGLLRNACEVNGFQCLAPYDMTFVKSTSPDEFIVDVQFRSADGSLFIRGPCCGASPTDQPPESVFTYHVIRSSQGGFLVSEMPPYVP
jgi:hypothetical protein